MIDAIRDSMYPTISPGDHIVIEQVEDPKIRFKYTGAEIIFLNGLK